MLLGRGVREGRCGKRGAGTPLDPPAGTRRELLPPQCVANAPKLSFGCVAVVSLHSHSSLSFAVLCVCDVCARKKRWNDTVRWEGQRAPVERDLGTCQEKFD